MRDIGVTGVQTCALPIYRAKGGMKRSQLSEGAGVPIATVSATANTVDHALLAETLDALKDLQPLPADVTVHLDAGYDYRPCREALEERGLHGQIAHRGTSAPIQVGRRGVIERTNSWLNDFGRLRRCTERRRDCVDAYLALAAAIVTVRALLRAAWYRYRWNTRPDHHASADLLAGALSGRPGPALRPAAPAPPTAAGRRGRRPRAGCPAPARRRPPRGAARPAGGWSRRGCRR